MNSWPIMYFEDYNLALHKVSVPFHWRGHLYVLVGGGTSCAVHVSYVINGCLAKVFIAIDAFHILSRSNLNAFSLGRDRTTLN